MPLSKKDQEFYQEKLGWKSFGYLMAVTVVMGAVVWPISLYVMDWSAGNTGKWSANVVYNLSVMGFLLGTVVSVVMYLIFKFFLQMGWLPKPR